MVLATSFALAQLLEALERRGLTRTLAEPNLTALSGQEARFLAGGVRIRSCMIRYQRRFICMGGIQVCRWG